MESTRIVEASTDADYGTARALFEEYAQATGLDVCFQGFAEELDRLPSMYGGVRGRMLLAWHGGRPVGCVALRTREPGVCEMKRLYVRPEARGAGLGRRLALAVIESARDMGYATMLLDTLAAMVAAQALYGSLGFVERAPYYANPQEGVRFLELRLENAPARARA